MINSKRKGAAGEREFSNYCKSKGFDTRRTAQYNGKEQGSLADVIGIDGIHIEVKRVEHLNIHDAVKQAKRDNLNHNDIPIVAHRKNNTKWLITMEADDWFTLFYNKEV
jgi:Holliday junction resolvase